MGACHEPTTRAIDCLRTQRGLKWATPTYLFAMSFGAIIVEGGGPGHLKVLVMLLDSPPDAAVADRRLRLYFLVSPKSPARRSLLGPDGHGASLSPPSDRTHETGIKVH